MDILTRKGFQLKSNMINIKKSVLLVKELIQVSLLAFHVISQVLIINIPIITAQKVEEIKLNGIDKLQVVFLLFFLSFFLLLSLI